MAIDRRGPAASETPWEDEEADLASRRTIWERVPRWITVPLFGAVLVLIWQVAVWMEVTSEFVLPPPGEVATELGQMLGNLFTGGYVLENLWVTMQEVFIGLLVAMVAGIGLGIVIAETSFGRQVVLPFVIGINAAPKVAFAPIFVAWLGFGIWAKVAMGAFIAFFPLLIDTAAGLANVDADQAKLFRAIRASRVQMFFKLKLPGGLPFIFAGLKTASVLAVVGAIVGEFLGGGAGFGSLI
ncbi:MAG TPA: ABC transporter permease, partial [Actinomycetota bacterium]|nr:ABC transporter permease [Actinomycetota bacterium]